MPVVDTLLHECAHMLAPPGSAHGKNWKAIARALSAVRRSRPPRLYTATPIPHSCLQPTKLQGQLPCLNHQHQSRLLPYRAPMLGIRTMFSHLSRHPAFHLELFISRITNS